MNFIQKTPKKHFWIYLIAGILLIFVAIIFQEYFLYQNQPDKISQNFQSVFYKKEKKITDELEFLKREFSKHTVDRSLKLSKKYQEIFEKTGLAFLIYEKDSLVFWSSNAIPGIETLKKSELFKSSDILKLQNGWYKVNRKQDLSRTFVGLILVEHCYPFRNEYLNDNFQEDFHVPANTKITNIKEKYTIYSTSGTPLFSLIFPAQCKIPASMNFILFILYLTGFFSFLTFLYKLYDHTGTVFQNKGLMLIWITADILLLRLLLFFFRIPHILYNSDLFGPEYFSSSQLLPSLGDFLVNSLLLLFLAYIFFKHYPGFIKTKGKRKSTLYIIGFLQIFCIAFCFGFSLYLIRDLVINSSLSLNLQNIANITLPSIIGFIIIAAVFLSFFLVAFRLSIVTLHLLGKSKNAYNEMRTIRISLSGIVCFLVFFSVVSTGVLNYYNDHAEKEKRKLLAVKLGVERDPIVEMMFSRQEDAMLKDTVLQTFSETPHEGSYILMEDSLARIIQRKYFREVWNNYSVQVTICSGENILKVQPQNYLYNCNSYFQNIVKEFGKPTGSRQLFYLDYGYGYKNYLAVIPVKFKLQTEPESGIAYIEISSKLILKDQGYPGLLIDNPHGLNKDLSEYSYAFYRNTKLIQRFGNIDYSLELDHTIHYPQFQAHFYSKDGYNHFCYPINHHDFLIISKKEPSLMDKIAPFSYLFFFFSFFSILFYTIVHFHGLFRTSFTRMGERIQVSMTSVLIISFLIIGALIILYINQLNARKNIENLNERTHSILVELQHKFGSLEIFDDQNTDGLNELMTKLSNVFFSDINLYDPQGLLIATSRPEIFEEGLISKMMNQLAFKQLRYAHSSFYILDEQIGTHHYNSAYMPLYNDRNQLLAYLNLPYFARQEEMKHEISSFLVTFINVYVFQIILGIIISLIVSSYITHPLKILTTRIGRVTFGKNNVKIDWKRKDEIGKLIEEYNMMIDELAKSADILIRSEREGAWREMARQVAHEIKNPLTPMKLSVQYLVKVWHDKTPDWENKLNRFSQTMIGQIEALSSIAAEFSNFAQMPAAKNELLLLDEVLQRVMDLYQNFPSIKYVCSPSLSGRFIKADRKQLERVFTNLINNAIQAIGNNPQGNILLSLEDENETLLVKVADNGIGIPKEQTEQVFLPNFTTKSGGMGLGLAIVKNIIKDAGGEISFISKQDVGTTFFLWFPSVNN